MLQLEDELPLEPMGSSLKDLRGMPETIRGDFGGALRMAQLGENPEGATPWGEGLSREIKKFTVRHDTDTYRMAFTWDLPGAVYLLDVFKKKAKSGRSTPQKDLDRIESRWKDAQSHHDAYYGE
ncbi:MAG: type II toxin-antitoxin system RelE/ParE family toxin [Gemmatimonadota bacterium]